MRAAWNAGDVSRGRNKPFGAGDHRFSLAAAGRPMASMRGRRRRRHYHAAAGRHRRRSQSTLGAIRPQDRTRSRIDRYGDDRRYCRQQCKRHVLRNGAEQLQHPGGNTRHPGGRHSARHARSGEPGRIHRAAEGSGARAGRAGKGCKRQRAAGGAHPAQVPHEEYHRLQPERAGGLHGSARHSCPLDHRLGGYARIYLRGHVPYGAGIRRTRRVRSSCSTISKLLAVR